jgi:homoserine dehydrogenase
MSTHRVAVAIVGCGTVGGHTARLLTSDEPALQKRTGISIHLKYLVDLDFAHARQMGLPESLFQSDLSVALDDPEVSTVVELIGGTTVAKDVVAACLRAGKNVVTANKALLAHHGPELLALARESGTAIAFEASCGGGIPVIRAITDGLAANRIDAIFGIVNGTCNYILSEMIQRGQTYEQALRQAQASGLAEADPTLDVSGLDTAHKLAILASLAFGCRVDLGSIPVQGIDHLDVTDVQYGQELGYVVKLLAIGQRLESGISLRVAPVFISTEHPLAWVSGPFNAVSVYGNVVGHTMYYGRGAGGSPTASAVVADIVSLGLENAQRAFHQLPVWPDRTGAAKQLDTRHVTSRYYLRAMVYDRPGVLARIASVLGEHNISISSVLQKELPEEPDHVAPIIITTHRAVENDVIAALDEVNRLDAVRTETVCISILDEHPENLVG